MAQLANFQQALDQVLQKIKSGNQQSVKEAEEQAKLWEADETYPMYAFALAMYMATPQCPPEDRKLCAVLLRGTLTPSVSAERKHIKQQKWLKTPEEAKLKIKQACLSVMADPIAAMGNQAAQIVAKIAQIEIPQGQWPELIPTLFAQSTKADAPPNLRKATLDAFGYICEELKPEQLGVQGQNQILTSVIHGMRPEEQDKGVKLSAATALFNALNFCKANFEKEAECKVIMESILHAMTVDDEEIVFQGYAILTQVASQHYDKLPPFMNDIFKITLAAMQKGEDEENITMMAIEFWCTICDEELNILEEIEEARENNQEITKNCKHFIKGALSFLVNILTTLLTQQEEGVDSDECTIPVAATVCLTLIAQCAKDDVVQHVMPFVERNLGSEDWKHREAAHLAFGSILEGPEKVLKPLITQVTPYLARTLKDPSVIVKDTSAWALGNILRLHPLAVIQHGDLLVKNLCETLGDPSPRVAAKACVALNNLSLSFEDEAENPLNKHFVTVVRMLLLCADRRDSAESHLIVAAYESLNVVLYTAPKSVQDNLLPIVQLMLDRITASFQMGILNKQNQLQGLLCGVLQVLAQKMDVAITPLANEIMMQVISLFRSKRDSGVYEEGLLCVGAIANVTGPNFNKYMQDLLPALLQSLANGGEYQVCKVAVGVVGDIARALGTAMEPYCDRIIGALLENLKNKDLNRSVKPPILSAFGDIALAIGPAFEKYVDVVLHMLKQAALTVMNTKLEPEDHDLIDYINLLREGICEAYTASIQTMNTETIRTQDKIAPHFPAIFQFILHIANDPHRSEAVTRGAVGIIGDLASTYTVKVKPFMQTQPVQDLIRDCFTNTDSKESKQVAAWAMQVTRF